MHRKLESIGRGYLSNLRRMLISAREMSIAGRMVDVSVDPTHMRYNGSSMLPRWGTPWSTMFNRAFPGLYPLTAFDLVSGLFLYVNDFIGKASKKSREALGTLVAERILKCIEMFSSAGMTVRNVTGDEAMTSHILMERLKERGIHYLLALKSTSRLRGYAKRITRWTYLNGGKRKVGIVRNVPYYDSMTNLVVVKHDGRRYMYMSDYVKGALYIWRRFCRRGSHEKEIGDLKALNFEDRPSTNLFQVKGHVMACIYLVMLLRLILLELNLDPSMQAKTFRTLLTSQGYVRRAKGGKVIALIIVTRSMLKKIGRDNIEWEGGRIDFLWYQQRFCNKIMSKG